MDPSSLQALRIVCEYYTTEAHIEFGILSSISQMYLHALLNQLEDVRMYPHIVDFGNFQLIDNRSLHQLLSVSFPYTRVDWMGVSNALTKRGIVHRLYVYGPGARPVDIIDQCTHFYVLDLGATFGCSYTRKRMRALAADIRAKRAATTMTRLGTAPTVPESDNSLNQTEEESEGSSSDTVIYAVADSDTE
jgi:hypothetical protein